MNSMPARVVLAALAFCGAFFIAWMLALVLLMDGPSWIASLVALAAAVYAARSVWQGTAEGSLSVPVMAGLGALIVGGLGFVLGFFGPMLLAPEANQGPMLGLFITGPGGVVLGAIGGALLAHKRNRRGALRG